MKKIWLFLLPLALFTACGDDDASTDVRSQNKAQIEAYLAANNLTSEAKSLESGLYYIIHSEGTGSQPTTSSNVSVIYTGTQMDSGTVFDKSTSPKAFNLGEVVPGFSQGVQLIKPGGRITLYIPAHLAYGARQPSNNKVIIFDVVLVSINN